MKKEITPEDFVSLFSKIDGCLDVDISDVSNWLEAENNEGHALLTDDLIIVLCATEENKDVADENPYQ